MALFKSKKTKKEDTEKKAKQEQKDKEKQAGKQKEEKKLSMRQMYEQEASKKTAVKEGEAVKGLKRNDPGQRAYRILCRPLVTEKASIIAAEGKYVFEVSSQANKVEIAKAIFDLYGIKPIKVNIIKTKGKRVRSGRVSGRRKNRKKAIVTLPKGKSINVYEGV